MPQDQTTGAAGNAFGRETAKKIAREIGASLLSQRSNEATYQGNRVVIKCARIATTKIGVSYKMIDRLHSVIGAFQQPDGAFRLFMLPATLFKNEMDETRSRGASAGKVGVVARTVFVSKGRELQTVRITKS